MFGPFEWCGACQRPIGGHDGPVVKGVACSQQCYRDYQKICRYRSRQHYERYQVRYAAGIARRGHRQWNKVERARRILSGEYMPTPKPSARLRQIFEERGWDIWWLDER